MLELMPTGVIWRLAVLEAKLNYSVLINGTESYANTNKGLRDSSG